MNQELGYLRDELNYLLRFHSEHANKTINTVLLVWGGALVILGRDGKAYENIILYSFIVATIFFVSNMILYYSAIKYYDSAKGVFRLAAYISVFYENRPNEFVKIDGTNFCWELAELERWLIYDNYTGKSQLNYKSNVEHEKLSMFSVLVILTCIFLISLSVDNTWDSDIKNALVLICFIYFVISIYWCWKIPSYTYLKNDLDMRLKYLDFFIKYSLDTRHYSKMQLKDKFGEKLWDRIEMEMDKIEEEKRKQKERQQSRIGSAIGRIARFAQKNVNDNAH